MGYFAIFLPSRSAHRPNSGAKMDNFERRNDCHFGLNFICCFRDLVEPRPPRGAKRDPSSTAWNGSTRSQEFALVALPAKPNLTLSRQRAALQRSSFINHKVVFVMKSPSLPTRCRRHGGGGLPGGQNNRLQNHVDVRP